MSVDLTTLLLAGGTTAAVGIAGALLVWLLARRSVPGATVAAPLVVVVAMAAGLVTSARAMFISDHDLGVVLLVLAATVPVGLVLGAVLLRLVRTLDAQVAAEAADRAQAGALETSRRQMVAWVSHDLRTPLAGIRAMAEALEDEVATDPPEYFARIRRETDRLAGMVDDLLALTSLHAGTTRLEMAPVALSDLVSDTLATLRPVAGARGVELTGYADGPARVVGDARQLSRALLNLTDNAVRHTPAGGHVRVRAGSAGDRVEVSVQDGCGGIPEIQLAHLFEPGWQASQARSPGQGRGAGLGLAVVGAIAAAHGGSATVVNHDPGCLATMHLPAAEPERPWRGTADDPHNGLGPTHRHDED